MENIEIIQQSPDLVRRPRGRPRIYPAKEINPDIPKRPRGRPRIYIEREINLDEPKKGRGRPRIHPVKEIDPAKSKKVYNKPGLSKAQHNKLYRLRHPEMNNKYWKKTVLCEVCQKEYLTRNIELHKNNKIHLANLFKKMQVTEV
jgi:hypothetical protein